MIVEELLQVIEVGFRAYGQGGFCNASDRLVRVCKDEIAKTNNAFELLLLHDDIDRVDGQELVIDLVRCNVLDDFANAACHGISSELLHHQAARLI